MKCPNCRCEIHSSALKCPYCYYVLPSKEKGGYATQPIYRPENQYGHDPRYSNPQMGYGSVDNRGYDYHSYNGTEYNDNYAYYHEQKKTDYGHIILPISIFILGLQLVILMLQVIVLLKF